MELNESVQKVEREIGAYVRARRKAAGVTQEKLAKKCKIVRRTLFSLENGQGGNVTTLLSVLGELGVLEEATAGFRDYPPAKPLRHDPGSGDEQSRWLRASEKNPWVMSDRAVL